MYMHRYVLYTSRHMGPYGSIWDSLEPSETIRDHKMALVAAAMNVS